MRLALWLSLFLFTAELSGCIQIVDTIACSPAGEVSAGGLCAHTLTGATLTLSFNEFVDFLEPQAARTCAVVPGMQVCADNQSAGPSVSLPARAGAISMSALDWDTETTELETACRELGDRCSESTQQTLALRHRLSGSRTAPAIAPDQSTAPSHPPLESVRGRPLANPWVFHRAL